MRLAIEQLRHAITVLERKVSDARGALKVAETSAADLSKQIEGHLASIHECNLAVESLMRPPKVEPTAAPKDAEPRKGSKPNALTSKG